MLDEYQNISLIFLLVDYILVVVCLCTDNYLIKIRIQWSDLCLVGFFFFFDTILDAHLGQQGQPLCYSLPCPHTDTLNINISVVKRGPHKVTQNICTSKFCSFFL